MFVQLLTSLVGAIPMSVAINGRTVLAIQIVILLTATAITEFFKIKNVDLYTLS